MASVRVRFPERLFRLALSCGSRFTSWPLFHSKKTAKASARLYKGKESALHCMHKSSRHFECLSLTRLRYDSLRLFACVLYYIFTRGSPFQRGPQTFYDTITDLSPGVLTYWSHTTSVPFGNTWQWFSDFGSIGGGGDFWAIHAYGFHNAWHLPSKMTSLYYKCAGESYWLVRMTTICNDSESLLSLTTHWL